MASFKFGSSAFNTPVGQRIEKVTDSSKASEDWALIIEICDIVNETEEGPKDAIKAIKKRLGNTKNYKTILYTLTLTEACVKNCGKRFHLLISTKDFLADLTKILTPKNANHRCPQVVQEKVLSLIQSWTDAFRNAPELQQVVHCYEELKMQGFEFPAQDLDTFSPIYTPTRLVKEDTSATPKGDQKEIEDTDGKVSAKPRARSAPARQQQQVTGPVQPSPESLSKLRSQLDIVEQNVSVMSEMLIDLSDVMPSSRKQDDLDLLKELNQTCRQMQQRVVDLIGKIANEEVTGELLRINDDLNNVFIRYDRFEKPHKERATEKEGQQETSKEPAVPVTSPAAAPPAAPPAAAQADTLTNGASIKHGDLLINFDGGPTEAQTLTPTATVQGTKQDDDFDMFAQSRSSTFTASRIGGSTYDDNSSGVPVESSIASAMSARGPYPKQPTEPVKEIKEDTTLDEDIQDVEEWLKDTDLTYLEEQAATEAQETDSSAQPTQQVSSAEFDRFLSERANVGPHRAASSRSTAAVPRQMEMMAGENKDDPFAL